MGLILLGRVHLQFLQMIHPGTSADLNYLMQKDTVVRPTVYRGLVVLTHTCPQNKMNSIDAAGINSERDKNSSLHKLVYLTLHKQHHYQRCNNTVRCPGQLPYTVIEVTYSCIHTINVITWLWQQMVSFWLSFPFP